MQPLLRTDSAAEGGCLTRRSWCCPGDAQQQVLELRAQLESAHRARAAAEERNKQLTLKHQVRR